MEARFAGSQRVGDRRRRRLAAGADDNADDPNVDNPVRMDGLSAPAGSIRAVDSAHTDALLKESSTTLQLPLANVIPAEGWKYVVGGLLGLAFSAAIVIAGCFALELQTWAGPAISGLFELPNGRVARSFSSLLLLLCAQLALLIWWARSRSLEDFEGRYWLWVRAACAWLAFSGCVSIEAHNVALDTLLSIRPGLSWAWANLGWMAPAATLGALLAGALVREMRGCRGSRALLLVACVCHLSAAALHLELESVFSSLLRAILVAVGILVGHVALFVSMWLHARHVVHCTADPAPFPTQGWRIPRPHFRLPQFRLARWRSRPARLDDEKTLEPRALQNGPQPRRKRPDSGAAAETTSQVLSGSAPDRFDAPAAERPAKPRIRFDSRHAETSQQAAPEDGAPPQRDAEGGNERRNNHSPIAMDSRKIGPAEPQGPIGQNVTEPAIGRDAIADSDEAAEEGLSKSELRGLSKKQRRRLMQELRDRERQSRR